MDENRNGSFRGLNIVMCGSMEKAQAAAAEHQINTQGRIIPANAYRQGHSSDGPRWFCVTAMGLPGLVGMTRTDPAKKGTSPLKSRNRPMDTKHAADIRAYIAEVDDYILPPFTVCTQTKLTFFCGWKADAGEFPAIFGFLVIPNDALFYMQDGQHRRAGAEQLIGVNEVLNKDGAAVVIYSEHELSQIQQDFVDCAKTKPIAKSLLVAYNRRSPISRFLDELINGVPLFKNRIEQVAQTIGKNSEKIFTTNNLQKAVAGLLVGNTTGSAALMKQLSANLTPDDLKKTCNFFNLFAKYNPEWQQIEQSSNGSVVHSLRTTHLTCSATGLWVIAEVGHAFLEDELLIAKLAKINWRRDAEIWKGNLVGSMGTSLSGSARTNLPIAIAKVRAAIGVEQIKEK